MSGGGFGIGEEGLVGDLGSGSDVRDRPHAVRAVEAPTAANVRNVLRARGVAGGMKAIRFFAGGAGKARRMVERVRRAG